MAKTKKVLINFGSGARLHKVVPASKLVSITPIPKGAVLSPVSFLPREEFEKLQKKWKSVFGTGYLGEFTGQTKEEAEKKLRKAIDFWRKAGFSVVTRDYCVAEKVAKIVRGRRETVAVPRKEGGYVWEYEIVKESLLEKKKKKAKKKSAKERRKNVKKKSAEMPSPTELGIRHGKQLIKKLSKAELERIARRKPMNEYEKAKITVIKEFLKQSANASAAKKKSGEVLKPAKRQTGKSRDVERDRKLKALPPGKRRSRSGKIYYEYRQNRSDLEGGV